jgi:hypothetical protein
MSKGLHQFIQDSCCNWYSGHCIGVNIMQNADGKLTQFNDTGKCFVMAGKRCKFFEQAVMPTGNQDIHDTYNKIAGATPKLTKKRFCSCGEPLSRWCKVCEKCSMKLRRATKREYQRKHRKRIVST